MPMTITDVLSARPIVARHLAPTPLWSYPLLDHEAGTTVLVKHENTQPTGAFKVRGGLTLLAGLDRDEADRGVVAYSTGNHAQSIAYAARAHGVPCVIVMPEDPNPVKVAAVRALGASVVLHGSRLEQAAAHATELAAERGMRLISAAAEPALIAGVGTLYAEIFEAAPDLDLLLVPVGGGSGAAAACLVARAMAPRCEIVAVQAMSSPAAHDSWRTGRCVERPNRTAAEGLATGAGFEFTQRILRDGLSDFLLVSDDQIRRAQRLLITCAHTLAEGAGAAALAGLLTLGARAVGRKAAVVCTGGNASAGEVAAALNTQGENVLTTA